MNAFEQRDPRALPLCEGGSPGDARRLPVFAVPLAWLLHALLPKDSLPVVDDEPEGELATIALKLLMKMMYVAQSGRCDILRATTVLAKQVAKSNKNCDRQLRRLSSYLNQTSSL